MRILARPRAAALLTLLCCSVGYHMSASAEDMISCGALVTYEHGGEQCLLFDWHGHSLCWLDNYGGFGDGDYVLVVGTPDEYATVPCGPSRCKIHVQSIQACRGFDFGCGTFEFYEDDCRYFYSWQYGPWFVDNWGGFEVGDTARVYGGIGEIGTWCNVRNLIMADSVVVCPDSLTAVTPVTWGRLKALFRQVRHAESSHRGPS
jgi:hypothetical protein